MAKRMLDVTASELKDFKKKDLLESIVKSEGRVMAAECIGLTMPVLSDVTNAEFVSAMGADIILLNMFDVKKPVIQALPDVEDMDTVRELKRLTGRMIGINLEPVETTGTLESQGTMWQMSEGRSATEENAMIARDMGVDMIL